MVNWLYRARKGTICSSAHLAPAVHWTSVITWSMRMWHLRPCPMSMSRRLLAPKPTILKFGAVTTTATSASPNSTVIVPATEAILRRHKTPDHAHSRHAAPNINIPRPPSDYGPPGAANPCSSGPQRGTGASLPESAVQWGAMRPPSAQPCSMHAAPHAHRCIGASHATPSIAKDALIATVTRPQVPAGAAGPPHHDASVSSCRLESRWPLGPQEQ